MISFTAKQLHTKRELYKHCKEEIRLRERKETLNMVLILKGMIRDTNQT